VLAGQRLGIKEVDDGIWEDVPLNKESMYKSRDKATIQYCAFEHLRDDYDMIFNDDHVNPVRPTPQIVVQPRQA
jgi:hypothetical protein